MKVGIKFSEAASIEEQRLQIDDAIGGRQTIFILPLTRKA